MPGRLIFITGGARSGKSAFAEKLARAHPGPVAYVATAVATDEEMARRIELHRRRRPDCWHTFECDQALGHTIEVAARDYELIVVDCLTVYLSRLLPHVPEGQSADLRTQQLLESRLSAELDEVTAAVRAAGRDVIIVSNEVGFGLVPVYPAGRLFRDMVGRANQRLAAAATFAYLVVAGMPLRLNQPAAGDLPWSAD